MEKLTLEEVGQRAGVSRSTVSRVINNQPGVTPEVRARVEKVIRETGFLPNVAARSLASQRSGVLGFVIPRSVHTVFSDPYYSRLTEGIAKACNLYGYVLSLFLFYTEDDERKLMPRIFQRGFLDGLIVQASTGDEMLLKHVANSDIPHLFLGRPLNLEKVNFIDVDNYSGAINAVSHLFHLGRRKIAHITGALDTAPGQDRLHGYEEALRRWGLPVEPALVAEGDFTEMGGYYACKRLLAKSKPDAIFVASDTMALGALRAVHEAGLSVPDDIALVGYDDLPPAQYANPPLTTIRQPVQRFGIQAVKTMVDILEAPDNQPRRIIYDTELIVRKSCGAQ